jgi:hypothetical protein
MNKAMNYKNQNERANEEIHKYKNVVSIISPNFHGANFHPQDNY